MSRDPDTLFVDALLIAVGVFVMFLRPAETEGRWVLLAGAFILFGIVDAIWTLFGGRRGG